MKTIRESRSFAVQKWNPSVCNGLKLASVEKAVKGSRAHHVLSLLMEYIALRESGEIQGLMLQRSRFVQAWL